jgi:hypothetical protein
MKGYCCCGRCCWPLGALLVLLLLVFLSQMLLLLLLLLMYVGPLLVLSQPLFCTQVLIECSHLRLYRACTA